MAKNKGANGETEILIGVKMIEYMRSVESVLLELGDALVYTLKCKSILEDGNAYEGKALEEMNLYFQSLDAHLQKLVLFYQAAETYLANAFVTMYNTEEEVLEILEQLGEG